MRFFRRRDILVLHFLLFLYLPPQEQQANCKNDESSAYSQLNQKIDHNAVFLLV